MASSIVLYDPVPVYWFTHKHEHLEERDLIPIDGDVGASSFGMLSQDRTIPAKLGFLSSLELIRRIPSVVVNLHL
jgi:hypothetical protein